MDEDNSFDEQIEIKEAFTTELLMQIDIWNAKLKKLSEKSDSFFCCIFSPK